MKRFAFLFTFGYKIVWSEETEQTLTNRIAQDQQRVSQEVKDFIAHAKPGYHMQLPSGEFIFCTE